jgi:predicted nucleic acid-binding protein
MRSGNSETVNAFVELFGNNGSISCMSIQRVVAQRAAGIRAHKNLMLLDAFRIAIALENQCDVFLTNDKGLCRITEVKVLTMEQLDGKTV